MEENLYRQIGKDEKYKTWHASKVHLFMLVHRGDGCVVTHEKTASLFDGALVFIGGELMHYTFPEHPERYERSKLAFSEAERQALCALLGEDQVVKPNALCIRALSAETQRELASDFEKVARLDGLAHRASRIALLAKLYSALVTEAVPDGVAQGGKMQSAVAYINAHLSEEMTLDDVARAAHMSKYHFCRTFKATVGVGVSTYLLFTRISLAKELLSGKEPYTVSEIGTLCGFASPSHFSRAFKEKTGLSPLAYRKQKLSLDKF